MNGPAARGVPGRLAVAVAVVEAVGVLAFAVVLVVAAAGGDAADALGSLVLAGVALAVAGGMLWLGRCLAQEKRWPLGPFVTVQVLVAVVALSQIGPAIRQGSAAEVALRAALLLVAAGCAGLGLWSALRLASRPGPDDRPPGPARPARG